MIDARGLSCPEPVIMVMNALKTNADSYEVLVDNVTALENVSRYASHQGYKVEHKEEGSDFHIILKK